MYVQAPPDSWERSGAPDIALADAAAWHPAPYMLLRLAGKPYEELDRLKFTQTVAIFDAILAERTWIAEQKTLICDRLFAEIGKHTGALRSQLVALKRMLFNERRPTPALYILLKTTLPRELRAEVLIFFWRVRRLRRLLREGRTVFERELQTKRRLLQRSLVDDNFQKALQVGSPSLFKSLPDYLKAQPDAMRVKERKIEAGAFQYFMRMTAKTSPFSRFGPVALGNVDLAANQAMTLRSQGMTVRSLASFNLGVAAAVTAAISRAPEVQPHVSLRVNDSYYVQGHTIAFTRPKMVVDQAVYTQVNTLRQGAYLPLMRAIVEYVESQPSDAPVYAAAVIQQVAASHPATTPQNVATMLAKLIDSGLLLNELRLPSNTLDRLEALVAALEPLPGTEAIADEVRQLDQQVKRFADAAVAERQVILTQIRERVASLLRWFPPLSPDKAERDDFLMEDAVIDGLHVEFGQPFFANLSDDLSAFLECIAARDQGGLSSAWLRDIFTSTYGFGGHCAAVLPFASLYRQELNAVISGQADGISGVAYDRSSTNHARMLQYVQAVSETSPVSEQRERLLERDVLHALSEALGGAPAMLLSAALHLQIAAESWEAVEQGDYLAVLNFALPGFGHFFSRYCYLFEHEDGTSPLTAALQSQIEQLRKQLPEDQDLIELLSILDHNAQVHPCLTAQQIVPPDEHSTLPPERQLPIKALELAHDPATDQLHLVVRRADGSEAQRLIPMYMGFFHLMALPVLHRLFAEMSPSGYHMERLKPCEHFEGVLTVKSQSDPSVPSVRHYPRLRVGRLVIQRETWAFSPSAFPSGDAEDEFTRFLDTYAWAKQHGLPPEVFARSKRGRPRSKNDFHTDHKPALVDFENYFTLKTLFHLLDGDNIQAIQIEEMLPNPRQLFFRVDGQRYAVEFQIELQRGAEHHG